MLRICELLIILENII